ncbi:DUF2190 family protein [Aliarcobacter butzleri]|uniref:DUF2190 family protein n=1 Tax=Aliarcobacter butzleri TaxID=28197 RepID=UPI00125F42DD|nr:DUF2190 family protein [Aliarcobacter butzleri]
MNVAKEAVEKYDGRVITYTCTEEVKVGDVIPIGVSMIGIAVNSGLVGEEISVELEKVWTIKAKDSEAFVVGDIVYWDDTLKVITTDNTDTVRAGVAISSKTATAGTIDVKINV